MQAEDVRVTLFSFLFFLGIRNVDADLARPVLVHPSSLLHILLISCHFPEKYLIWTTILLSLLILNLSSSYKGIELPTLLYFFFLVEMPPSKPKPSEIAAEAKKTYIPYIRQNFQRDWPATSYLCDSDSLIARRPEAGKERHVRFGKLAI